MVGDNNGGSAGFHSLQSPGNCHDTFYDERHFGIADNLAHLFNRLAACIGVHGLEEGETRAVHIHCGGKDALGIENVQLLKNGLLVPRLDGGAANTADLYHVHNGSFHDLRVNTVAGEGHEAVVGCSLD